MSTNTRKPPDNSPRPPTNFMNGQTIAALNVDPKLEVMAISGQEEANSDDAGLAVIPTPTDFTDPDFLHYIRLWS